MLEVDVLDAQAHPSAYLMAFEGHWCDDSRLLHQLVVECLNLGPFIEILDLAGIDNAKLFGVRPLGPLAPVRLACQKQMPRMPRLLERLKNSVDKHPPLSLFLHLSTSRPSNSLSSTTARTTVRPLEPIWNTESGVNVLLIF